MIDHDQRLLVFRAQTENVRELERAWSYLNRQINDAIRTKSAHAVKINTKFLALNYCAIAEAKFSKLIHTPYGLELSFISQIKSAATSCGVKAGWEKCVELTLKSVPAGPSNHVPNVRQKLLEYIEKYIFDPSQLRNKLAHGQWENALNRENTALNALTTNEIAELNIVELYRKKTALDKLSSIIEDLIESPEKAHFNLYWNHVLELDQQMQEMGDWTFAKKAESILLKSAGAKCTDCGRRR